MHDGSLENKPINNSDNLSYVSFSILCKVSRLGFKLIGSSKIYIKKHPERFNCPECFLREKKLHHIGPTPFRKRGPLIIVESQCKPKCYNNPMQGHNIGPFYNDP